MERQRQQAVCIVDQHLKSCWRQIFPSSRVQLQKATYKATYSSIEAGTCTCSIHWLVCRKQLCIAARLSRALLGEGGWRSAQATWLRILCCCTLNCDPWATNLNLSTFFHAISTRSNVFFCYCLQLAGLVRPNDALCHMERIPMPGFEEQFEYTYSRLQVHVQC